MMDKVSKFEQNGLKTLETAYKQGRARSRHEDKKAGVSQRYVYAEKSFIEHKRNWHAFSKWADEKGVKVVGKVTEGLVKEYVQGLAEAGYSKKTIETRIGAINKVMLASQRWGVADKVSGVRALLGKEDARKLAKGSYKAYTSSEWVERNPEGYEKYKDLIDTAKSFGLRRRELEELRTSSFLVDKQGKMYVQTIGKGGKYRISEACDDEANERMRELFLQYARPIEEASEAGFRRDLQDEDLRVKIKGASSHKVPLHIHRAEYARRFVERLNIEKPYHVSDKKIGFSRLTARLIETQGVADNVVKIGVYQGRAENFMQVSQNLGHNRLDVLTKYLY